MVRSHPGLDLADGAIALFCGYAPDRAAGRAHNDALRRDQTLGAAVPLQTVSRWRRISLKKLRLGRLAA
jgi:hypothetical protein